MILAFPPIIANDNEARQYWTCFACCNGAFLLEYEDGRTTIHCALCHVDVTSHVPIEAPQCQP